VTGPQLRRHGEGGACAIAAAESAPAADGLPPVCGVLAHLPPSAAGKLSFGGRDVTLALLATSLPTQTGMAVIPHPVVDETGLSGGFDLRMEWVPEVYDETGNVAAHQPDVSGPTFAQALREQLGLKLESKKGPVEILVVDRVEEPSAN
jgi:uncharacterized protein (TIGR03435 family)